MASRQSQTDPDNQSVLYSAEDLANLPTDVLEQWAASYQAPVSSSQDPDAAADALAKIQAELKDRQAPREDSIAGYSSENPGDATVAPQDASPEPGAVGTPADDADLTPTELADLGILRVAPNSPQATARGTQGRSPRANHPAAEPPSPPPSPGPTPATSEPSPQAPGPTEPPPSLPPEPSPASPAPAPAQAGAEGTPPAQVNEDESQAEQPWDIDALQAALEQDEEAKEQAAQALAAEMQRRRQENAQRGIDAVNAFDFRDTDPAKAWQDPRSLAQVVTRIGAFQAGAFNTPPRDRSYLFGALEQLAQNDVAAQGNPSPAPTQLGRYLQQGWDLGSAQALALADRYDLIAGMAAKNARRAPFPGEVRRLRALQNHFVQKALQLRNGVTDADVERRYAPAPSDDGSAFDYFSQQPAPASSGAGSVPDDSSPLPMPIIRGGEVWWDPEGVAGRVDSSPEGAVGWDKLRRDHPSNVFVIPNPDDSPEERQHFIDEVNSFDASEIGHCINEFVTAHPEVAITIEEVDRIQTWGAPPLDGIYGKTDLPADFIGDARHMRIRIASRRLAQYNARHGYDHTIGELVAHELGHATKDIQMFSDAGGGEKAWIDVVIMSETSSNESDGPASWSGSVYRMEIGKEIAFDLLEPNYRGGLSIYDSELRKTIPFRIPAWVLRKPDGGVPSGPH